MKTSKYKGFCIVLVGTNGTGKTTFCSEIIKNYKRKVLAISDDDSEEYLEDNFYQIKVEQLSKIENGDFLLFSGNTKKENDVIFSNIYKHFNNGLLFFDDAMTVLNSRPDFVFPIFKKRRQRRNDIILNCHGFSEFPINLVKNVTHIVIAKTTDSIDSISRRINKEIAEQLKYAIMIVNQTAKKNPYFKIVFNLQEPKDYKSLYLAKK